MSITTNQTLGETISSLQHIYVNDSANILFNGRVDDRLLCYYLFKGPVLPDSFQMWDEFRLLVFDRTRVSSLCLDDMMAGRLNQTTSHWIQEKRFRAIIQIRQVINIPSILHYTNKKTEYYAQSA